VRLRGKAACLGHRNEADAGGERFQPMIRIKTRLRYLRMLQATPGFAWSKDERCHVRPLPEGCRCADMSAFSVMIHPLSTLACRNVGKYDFSYVNNFKQRQDMCEGRGFSWNN